MRLWEEILTWRREVILSEEENIGQKMGRETDSERRGGLEIGAVQSVRNQAVVLTRGMKSEEELVVPMWEEILTLRECRSRVIRTVIQKLGRTTKFYMCVVPD